MIKNKRGGEKLFSIWWFIILGLVGISVVLGVNLFLSKDIDVRGIESSILSSNVINCISKSNLVSEEFFDNDFDIYSYCSLNKKVIEESFYIQITLSDISGNIIKDFSFGNIDYKQHCEVIFQGSNVAKLSAINYPICFYNSEATSYFFEDKKTKGEINILVASNNAGKRLKS